MSSFLLPFGLPDLIVDRVSTDKATLTIAARATSRASPCPKCQHSSDRVHSAYFLSPRDLPIGDFAVRLVLHVRRFFCGNANCRQRTFAERFPTVVAVRAQLTKRLTARLQTLGFALGGRAAARLGHRLRLPVSPDTLLRLVRRAEPQQRPTPRVLGVDDFAFKKGRSYGTILVDLERHRPVDLLPDRTAHALKDWLLRHPGVEVIARDRSTEYCRGATEGAPQAMQVADRWHLLVNLREALERFLSRSHSRLRQLPLSAPDARILGCDRRLTPRPLRQPSPSEQIVRVARRENRRARWEAARTLFTHGTPIREIARRLNISRATARNFAYAEEYPERSVKKPQVSQIDPYVEYLAQRWEEGCHNASQLWREIGERGYKGARVQVARWVNQRREAPAASTRKEYVQPTASGVDEASISEGSGASLAGARKLVWLLLRSVEDLDEAERVTLQHIRQDPELVVAHDLARRFQAMVCRRRPEDLDNWVRAGKASKLMELQNFAGNIERDIESVRAGLAEPWSNGQTEGQINRLKLIKRQMYGRAGFDLLRQMVLQAS